MAKFQMAKFQMAKFQIFDTIIITGLAVGSIYMCVESLKLINTVSTINNKNAYKPFIILNGIVFIVSSSIFLDLVRSNLSIFFYQFS